MEARFRNQGYERIKVVDEINTLEDEMKSMVWRQQCGECCCGSGVRHLRKTSPLEPALKRRMVTKKNQRARSKTGGRKR